jgi:hypothetical protein
MIVPMLLRGNDQGCHIKGRIFFPSFRGFFSCHSEERSDEESVALPSWRFLPPRFACGRNDKNQAVIVRVSFCAGVAEPACMARSVYFLSPQAAGDEAIQKSLALALRRYSRMSLSGIQQVGLTNRRRLCCWTQTHAVRCGVTRLDMGTQAVILRVSFCAESQNAEPACMARSVFSLSPQAAKPFAVIARREAPWRSRDCLRIRLRQRLL